MGKEVSEGVPFYVNPDNPDHKDVSGILILTSDYIESSSESKNLTISMICRCKRALGGLLDNEIGLVIGSGDNTAKWIDRGWETIDIDVKLSPRPTYLGNANDLIAVLEDQGVYPDHMILYMRSILQFREPLERK